MSKLQDLNDAVRILRDARMKLPSYSWATPAEREADKTITDATIHLWKSTPVWDLINDQDVIPRR